MQRDPLVNLDSQLQSCCWEHLKGTRPRFEVPIQQTGSDHFGRNHQRLPASERCHSLVGSSPDLHSYLGVGSNFDRQGLVPPWEIDGLLGMLASSLPSWQTEAHLVGSLLQAHQHTGEIRIQAMPEESLGFVAAEVNIHRIDR